MWRKILIDIWHGEYIKNLKETGQKRASYSADVPQNMAKKSFTGVSWITCISTKIIFCIFIFKAERNKIFGVLF